jgi:hypothetical protein
MIPLGPSEHVGGVPEFWKEIKMKYKHIKIVKDWNQDEYGNRCFLRRVLVFEFFVGNVDIGEFEGKMVLEVESKYVNGSVRPFIKRFLKPREYIGIDIEPGKFIDITVPAEKLLNYF